MASIPETRFATVGNDRVAYQVLGDGPWDVLFTTGFWSHLDINWEEPIIARFFRRLGSFSRLIMFDRRGTGPSDRASDDGLTPEEHWLQDCLAVLDAADSSAPIIIGSNTPEVGALVLQFADRHPERCAGLILSITTACWTQKPDYPQGFSPEVLQRTKDMILQNWGQPEMTAMVLPSQAKNDPSLRWMAKWQRAVASPGTIAGNMDVLARMDARHLLARIQVPTLVLGRSSYVLTPLGQSRYMAEHIPNARFVELPGSDGGLMWDNPDFVLDLIEEFVTGRRHGARPDRALLTILFTDIVDSTNQAAKLGDSEWRLLLEKHDKIVREQVILFQGKFIESAGDGTLTTFDSPGLAIECARAIGVAVKSLGIDIRAGMHTGEVELRDDGRVGGMAVHIGARVQSLANAGEILVSPVVQGMLLGSRYQFEARGTHALKGVPGEWPLFAVVA